MTQGHSTPPPLKVGDTIYIPVPMPHTITAITETGMSYETSPQDIEWEPRFPLGKTPLQLDHCINIRGHVFRLATDAADGTANFERLDRGFEGQIWTFQP